MVSIRHKHLSTSSDYCLINLLIQCFKLKSEFIFGLKGVSGLSEHESVLWVNLIALERDYSSAFSLSTILLAAWTDTAIPAQLICHYSSRSTLQQHQMTQVAVLFCGPLRDLVSHEVPYQKHA